LITDKFPLDKISTALDKIVSSDGLKIAIVL